MPYLRLALRDNTRRRSFELVLLLACMYYQRHSAYLDKLLLFRHRRPSQDRWGTYTVPFQESWEIEQTYESLSRPALFALQNTSRLRGPSLRSQSRLR